MDWIALALMVVCVSLVIFLRGKTAFRLFGDEDGFRKAAILAVLVVGFACLVKFVLCALGIVSAEWYVIDS